MQIFPIFPNFIFVLHEIKNFLSLMYFEGKHACGDVKVYILTIHESKFHERKFYLSITQIELLIWRINTGIDLSAAN